MGDLDADRRPGRARAVLQMGDIAHIDLDRRELRSRGIRDLVDHQDGRCGPGQSVQELLDGHRRGGGGEQQGRGAVGEGDGQTLGVAGQLRGEQWYRNGPGLEHREEGGDIVQALRRHYRDPVTTRGGPLDARTDRAHPDVELRPGQLRHITLGAGEVQEPVRHRVTDIGHIALDQRHHRGAGRQGDLTAGVDAVLDCE